MNNQQKFETFLQITTALNQELDSVPILYGSLGLSRSIEQDLATSDIDFLVEERVFAQSLTEIRRIMAQQGFVLADPDENEFHRGDFKVGISHDGDMIEFSGINPAELKVEERPAKYRVLTPEQYLATYRASSKDGYRIEERQKDDASKIELLEALLND